MRNTNTDLLEKSLLTLDDSVFFHIIRNYLGKIETPFHKPTLIKRLFKFLSQEDSKNRILSRIDNRDRVILTAIHNFDFPELGMLMDHLLQDFNYFEFHSAIQNLEERLLIFEFENRLFINPLFYTDLSRKILQTNWNIHAREFSPSIPGAPWLTEPRLFGLLGFLYQRNSVFYKDTSLRKKVTEECCTRLFSVPPDQSGDTVYETRIQFMYKCLQRLGFVTSTDAGINVKFARISDFISLQLHDRILYIWAAYITVAYPEEQWPTTQQLADIISSICSSMPGNLGFDRKSLNYLIGLISPDFHNKLRNYLIDGLLHLDVFVEDEGIIGLSPLINMSSLMNAKASPAPITFHAGVSFTLDAMYSIQALVLSVFTADLISVDYVSQFEITKVSVHKGAQFFEESIVDLYRSQSTGMSQSAEFTVSQWTEQLDDIELFSGITIKVKERILHLFEDIIEDFDIQRLGNGIFVIPGELLLVIQTAIERQGILVPGISEPNKTISSLSSRLTAFKPLSYKKIDIRSSEQSDQISNKPDFLDTLYKTLARTNLSRNEREEIEEKIKGGMILFPEQITAAICRKDKVEAKGIDYQGKLNLIQQALKNRVDLLSIETFDDSFELITTLILPLRLIKESENHVLEARVLPGETIHTYPVNQLSKVRLVRKSLYAN